MLQPREMQVNVSTIMEEMVKSRLNLNQVLCSVSLSIESMPVTLLNKICSYGQLAEAAQMVTMQVGNAVQRVSRAGLYAIEGASVVSVSEPVNVPMARAYSCVAEACRNQCRLVQARQDGYRLQDEDGQLLYVDPRSSLPRCRSCGVELEEIMPMRLMGTFFIVEVHAQDWQPIPVLVKKSLPLGAKVTLYGIPNLTLSWNPQFNDIGPYIFQSLGEAINQVALSKPLRIPLCFKAKRERKSWRIKGIKERVQAEIVSLLDTHPLWLLGNMDLRSAKQKQELADLRQSGQLCCISDESPSEPNDLEDADQVVAVNPLPSPSLSNLSKRLY